MLGLIVLAIVLGLVNSGSVDIIAISEIAITSVGFWLAMTLFGVFVVAKVIDRLCPRNGVHCLPGDRSHGRHAA